MRKLAFISLLAGVALFISLGATTLNADMKCGAGKCGGSTSKPITKCGTNKKESTKCGANKKMPNKDAVKCGANKKMPKKNSKCGADK